MGSAPPALWMISRTASTVSRRCGAGRPYSAPCQVSLRRLTPAPSPSRKRPPEASSMSSAESAMIIGLRVKPQAIPVPTPIVSVAGGQPHRLGQRAAKSSTAQTQSIPAASAARACSARSPRESPRPAICTRSRAVGGLTREPTSARTRPSRTRAPAAPPCAAQAVAVDDPGRVGPDLGDAPLGRAIIALTSLSSPRGDPSARIARTSASSAGTATQRDPAGLRRRRVGRRPRSSAAASTRAFVEWQIRSASARNSTLAIGRDTPAG